MPSILGSRSSTYRASAASLRTERLSPQATSWIRPTEASSPRQETRSGTDLAPSLAVLQQIRSLPLRRDALIHMHPYPGMAFDQVSAPERKEHCNGFHPSSAATSRSSLSSADVSSSTPFSYGQSDQASSQLQVGTKAVTEVGCVQLPESPCPQSQAEQQQSRRLQLSTKFSIQKGMLHPWYRC